MAVTETASFTDIPPTWTPSWEVDAFNPDRLANLIADLTPSDEIRTGRDFGVHVLDGSDPHSDIGRFIEWTRFEEKFGNDIDKMRELYQPYDKVSTFLTVIDYEAQKPVGVIRIVKPIGEELITLQELVSEGSAWAVSDASIEDRKREMGYEAGHSVDITTMAVMPDYSSNHAKDGASAALYSTCVRWSLANGYNHWATIVDKRIHDQMQSWGEPFDHFKDTDFAPFEGSEASIPVYTELHSGLEKVRAFNEDVYKLYTEGAGLDLQYVLPQIILPQVS